MLNNQHSTEDVSAYRCVLFFSAVKKLANILETQHPVYTILIREFSKISSKKHIF
jgi:hypothetical protein